MRISCTICTDVVEPDENIHATTCGHVFHNHCLSDWIVRSNTCPQCRRVVTDGCMLRIYPTFSDEKDLTPVQARLHHALELYKDLQTVCVEKEESLKKATDELKRNEESLEIYMSELDSRNSEVEALKQRVESVEFQNMEVHRLLQENASLNDNIRTLKGEIQRQNLLYNELMAQITLQRYSLETHTKEAVRLRDENEALKKNLRSLNGELRRHKSLYDELRKQVTLQKDERSILEPQSTKSCKVNDGCSKNNEQRLKMISKRAVKVEPKKMEPPRTNLPAQSSDTACVTEKMDVLSQKLHLAKTSHLQLSGTLVKLIVAWLKLKKKGEQNSLIIHSPKNTSQTYEDDFINRLSKILSIDDTKLLSENTLKARDTRQNLIKVKASQLEQNENTTKIPCENELQRVNDFFTKLSERETLEFKREDTKKSLILSPVETASKSVQYQDDFQTAIHRVLVSDTLKNYKKNFKSFDMGLCVKDKNTDNVKDNSGLKLKGSKEVFNTDSIFSKVKGSKEVITTRSIFSKVKGSKEGFEFDATLMYGGQNVGRKPSVFKFEARGLPKLPPMPTPPMPLLPDELKKASKQHAKKNSGAKRKTLVDELLAPLYARERTTRTARRRIPPHNTAIIH